MGGTMVDFRGVHFPKKGILYAVFFYLRYPGSYRDLEEILEERGVDVDHGTLNRWVVKFAPLMPEKAQSHKNQPPNLGAWTKPTSRFKANGPTITGRSTTRGKTLISFCLSVATRLRPVGFQARDWHERLA